MINTLINKICAIDKEIIITTSVGEKISLKKNREDLNKKTLKEFFEENIKNYCFGVVIRVKEENKDRICALMFFNYKAHLVDKYITEKALNLCKECEECLKGDKYPVHNEEIDDFESVFGVVEHSDIRKIQDTNKDCTIKKVDYLYKDDVGLISLHIQKANLIDAETYLIIQAVVDKLSKIKNRLDSNCIRLRICSENVAWITTMVKEENPEDIKSHLNQLFEEFTVGELLSGITIEGKIEDYKKSDSNNISFNLTVHCEKITVDDNKMFETIFGKFEDNIKVDRKEGNKND